MQPLSNISVQPLPAKRNNVKVTLHFCVAEAEIESESYAITDATVLHPTVTPPRRKCGATKWLLAEFRRCIRNEGAALMYLELLVSNLRSTTFSLQKLMSGIPGFREWYATKQVEMKGKTQLRWIVDLRNAAEKEGLVSAEFGQSCVFRHYLNGKMTTEPGLPIITVAEFGSTDILDTLEFSAAYLSRLVEDAHSRFLSSPPDRQSQVQMEFVRECPDGSWEHFDPE